VARRRPVRWRNTSARAVVGEVDLARPTSVSIADLREPIEHGQVVSSFTLEGATGASRNGWRTLTSGTTIGHRRLARFEPTRVSRLRLTVETIAPLAMPVELKLY
jgi:alpha-L-fucosidase